jgi:hypothetical protein
MVYRGVPRLYKTLAWVSGAEGVTSGIRTTVRTD